MSSEEIPADRSAHKTTNRKMEYSDSDSHSDSDSDSHGQQSNHHQHQHHHDSGYPIIINNSNSYSDGHGHGHSHIHGPQCKHQHFDKGADCLTNTSAGGKFFSAYISTAYWLAGYFDLACGFESKIIGLSYYAMVFGLFMAALCAGGAAYSHRQVNTQYQAKTSEEENPLIKTHSKSDPETTRSCFKANSGLTFFQTAMLAGDAISHTVEDAAPITFVVNLVTDNKLTRETKLLVQCGATLFGGITSIANVRTCRNAMLKNNKSNKDGHGHGHDSNSDGLFKM